MMSILKKRFNRKSRYYEEVAAYLEEYYYVLELPHPYPCAAKESGKVSADTAAGPFLSYRKKRRQNKPVFLR